MGLRHREGALQWREEGKRGMGDSCSGLGVCGVGSFAAKEKKKKGEREREREWLQRVLLRDGWAGGHAV